MAMRKHLNKMGNLFFNTTFQIRRFLYKSVMNLSGREDVASTVSDGLSMAQQKQMIQTVPQWITEEFDLRKCILIPGGQSLEDKEP